MNTRFTRVKGDLLLLVGFALDFSVQLSMMDYQDLRVRCFSVTMTRPSSHHIFSGNWEYISQIQCYISPGYSANYSRLALH